MAKQSQVSPEQRQITSFFGGGASATARSAPPQLHGKAEPAKISEPHIDLDSDPEPQTQSSAEDVKNLDAVRAPQ